MSKEIHQILGKIWPVAVISTSGYIVILGFVQIALQYFAPADLKSFAWGDEVVRLMIIWVVFLTTSVGVKQESRLGVQFFLDRFLSEFQMKIAKRCATAVAIATLAAMTYTGAMHVMENTTNILQDLPDITIAWFYAAILVGGFYLILEYAVQLLGRKDGAEEEVGR